MKSKSILLVVDDWERLERYSDFFSKNYFTTEAPFPSEGVKFAQLTQYDSIVVDLSLGDMTEQEFILNIGSDCKSKVYVITDVNDFHKITEISLSVICISRSKKLIEILDELTKEFIQ